MSTVFVGVAGFSVPRGAWKVCGAEGSHLERTSRLFGGVEINTSFYRNHQKKTYERWAESVPAAFRFAVKLDRVVTHMKRLRDGDAEIERFLDETSGLGEKRGPILVQLPPSLAFDPPVAELFFRDWRRRTPSPTVCEPRHPTWFRAEAEALLRAHGIARCAADPAPAPGAGDPAASADLVYFRLHGSPEMYLSPYDVAATTAMAARIKAIASQKAREIWCIFDNTIVGHATFDALRLTRELEGGAPLRSMTVIAPARSGPAHALS